MVKPSEMKHFSVHFFNPYGKCTNCKEASLTLHQNLRIACFITKKKKVTVLVIEVVLVTWYLLFASSAEGIPHGACNLWTAMMRSRQCAVVVSSFYLINGIIGRNVSGEGEAFTCGQEPGISGLYRVDRYDVPIKGASLRRFVVAVRTRVRSLARMRPHMAI